MSPTPSIEPGASVQGEASECPPVDLFAPSGTRVSLTGVWRSNDFGLYTIHQDGTCLYWMGMSNDSGTGPGELWTNVFIGTVHSDFTVVGRWGDVPFNADEQCQRFGIGAGTQLLCDRLGRGTMTVEISFDQSGGREYPVLREIASTGPFGGSVWVLEESLSADTDLGGIFSGNVAQECNWIESNGQRYELIVGGFRSDLRALGGTGWVIRADPLSVQTLDGQIVARVGDPIRVSGQLSAALGSECTDQAILVEELDPTP